MIWVLFSNSSYNTTEVVNEIESIKYL